MIILDTNVVSELLRPEPNQMVVEWFEGQPSASLFLTTIVEGELLYGVNLLPDGARRLQLATGIRAIFDEDFQGRVLSFDRSAAVAFSDLAAARRIAGKPMSQFDAMIAAIAISRGAALATRNTRDFVDSGLELINPWL